MQVPVGTQTGHFSCHNLAGMDPETAEIHGSLASHRNKNPGKCIRPRQYLQKRYTSVNEKKTFAASLLRLLPLDPSVEYQTILTVPEITEAEMGTKAP